MFGAFGCGKTKTLVEITKQIVKNIPEARILICAPSNSAADVFATNLANFREFHDSAKKSTLLRFYAMHYKWSSVPEELRQHTYYLSDQQIFDHPEASVLKQKRVIVSTTSNAAALYGLGVGTNFFTHIIIDEAAQQMEPESLIPLSLATPKTTIILAGDDKQLGPRLQSRSVKHFKLGVSIMQRLRDGNSPYLSKECGHRTLGTEVTRSFR